jgi:hypothetical protein
MSTPHVSTLFFLQNSTCLMIMSISVELHPIRKISTPQSIADFRSSKVENPGMLCMDNFVFFKNFLALFKALTSETLLLPIDNDEAPRPFP